MTYSYNPLASLGLDKSIPLDGSGKIPSDYLPSYVDDVVEYDDLASFPGTGETGKIYVAKDTGYTYRWTGSVYVRIGSGGEVELNLGLQGSPSLFFTGDTNTGIYSPGADQLALSTNGTGRLFVDASGRVGIGATPAGTGQLHVINNAGNVVSQFLSQPSGSCTIYLGTTSTANSFLQYDDSAGYLRWFGGGSERLRIDNAGRLLVGTSSAANVPYGSQIECSSTSGVAISNLRFGNNAFGPTLQLGKSRSASVNGYTIVSSGDTLGQLVWVGADGVDMLSQAASISAQVDGTPGANDMPGRLVFSTTSDGASSPTERMRIRSNGNTRLFSNEDGYWALATASAGTTYTLFQGRHSATDWNSGTDAIVIYTNGNVANTNNSYGQLTSDERFKQDIVDANSQWDDLKNIRITNYHWKSDPTGPMLLGPIAQELQAVCPGLVDTRIAKKEDEAASGGLVSEGDEVLSFKASILYMKAVKALQEAMERIETLEAEVAALKA